MAADTQHRYLFGFIILCLIKVVFGRIIVAPENTLVVRCEDKFANMSCASDREDEIAWTYDGNTVINSPCRSNEPGVFEANPQNTSRCDIGALLEGARLEPSIKRISGAYGCTDRYNDGRTNTSMVIVLDAWCGVVDSCPVMEGDDVTVGCFGHYDWLPYYLQYNPIVTINSTLQFVEKPQVSMSEQPQVPPFTERPPLGENLTASYTIRNVKAGDVIRSTCHIDFSFSESKSPRIQHSTKILMWQCTINQPVHYCPRNVTIDPANGGHAGTVLRCSASSYPAASYQWIDHTQDDAVVSSVSTLVLPLGKYNLTCVASVTIQCPEGRKVCQDPDSYWDRNGRNADFPFNLFNLATPRYNSTRWCTANTSISGLALTTASTSTLTTTTTATTSEFSTVIIAGIAAGAAVVIVVVIAVSAVICCNRKAKASKQVEERNDDDEYHEYDRTSREKSSEFSSNDNYESIRDSNYTALQPMDPRKTTSVSPYSQRDYLEIVG